MADMPDADRAKVPWFDRRDPTLLALVLVLAGVALCPKPWFNARWDELWLYPYILMANALAAAVLYPRRWPAWVGMILVAALTWQAWALRAVMPTTWWRISDALEAVAPACPALGVAFLWGSMIIVLAFSARATDDDGWGTAWVRAGLAVAASAVAARALGMAPAFLFRYTGQLPGTWYLFVLMIGPAVLASAVLWRHPRGVWAWIGAVLASVMLAGLIVFDLGGLRLADWPVLAAIAGCGPAWAYLAWSRSRQAPQGHGFEVVIGSPV